MLVRGGWSDGGEVKGVRGCRYRASNANLSKRAPHPFIPLLPTLSPPHPFHPPLLPHLPCSPSRIPCHHIPTSIPALSTPPPPLQSKQERLRWQRRAEDARLESDALRKELEGAEQRGRDAAAQESQHGRLMEQAHQANLLRESNNSLRRGVGVHGGSMVGGIVCGSA